MQYIMSGAGAVAWSLFCASQDVMISQGLGRAFIVLIPVVLIGSLVHHIAERI